MKIYASRKHENDVVAYLQKFVNKDIWIKIQEVDSTTYLARITSIIHKGQLPLGIYFITYEYLLYNLFEHITQGGPIGSEEVIQQVMDGWYTRCTRDNEIKICHPLEIYTTEDLKEILGIQ